MAHPPASGPFHIYMMFAFDIGYEIDLERARPLVLGESGALARRPRRTPESIRYRPAPLRVGISPSGLGLPGGVGPCEAPRADLTIFDFGALSLTWQFPVRLTPEGLLELAGALADSAALTAAAREAAAPWVERLRPAVSEFEPSDLSEEYFVFQADSPRIARLDAADFPSWVARLIRLDPGELGREEVREATRLSLAYTPDDYVALDWAAGFVADRDCADTLQVIEFANVQLLEFRHIDDRLDDRLEAAYRLIHPGRPRPRRPRWPLSLRPHAAALRNIRELEIEATSLFERADNNLKLIGDQYLSRIFGLASARFHLHEWQQSIRRKLEAVGDVYDLLESQAGGARMEFLELVVIILIALEIVLALTRH